MYLECEECAPLFSNKTDESCRIGQERRSIIQNHPGAEEEGRDRKEIHDPTSLEPLVRVVSIIQPCLDLLSCTAAAQCPAQDPYVSDLPSSPL